MYRVLRVVTIEKIIRVEKRIDPIQDGMVLLSDILKLSNRLKQYRRNIDELTELFSHRASFRREYVVQAVLRFVSGFMDEIPGLKKGFANCCRIEALRGE